MASFQLLPPYLPLHQLHFSRPSSRNLIAKPSEPLKHQTLKPRYLLKPPKSHKLNPPRASINGEDNGSIESSEPTRRGRKKGPTSSSSSSATSPLKKTKRLKKAQVENGTVETAKPTIQTENPDSELEDYDDGIDFPYDDPPLVCCFGAVQKEFVPTVRVSDNPMHPDIYSQWKMLQWDPPEFVRAPGGSPSNVAISHVRLGGRAAFMGKVGDDDFGDELVLMMNKEKVQTRAVKFDRNAKTACTYMKIKFDDEKMWAETVKESAEDSLLSSELNLAVLKEARIFHFSSEVLTSPSMQSTLLRAMSYSKKFGGLVFFDVNLPLPLWKSRDETRKYMERAWNEADIIEVSRQELEFLLDEDYYVRKRNYRPQYYAEEFEQTKKRRDYYHYTPEEISPLWHDGLKFLFVTDGTLRIHYYSPSFHGVVIGTEDVLITPFTCDRTGSGDAVVAAIMRKLTTYPEMYENQDVLERQLRFAVAAGIISQWTIGAVRGFPTESATQNLKEQVYVPSMW
ncbi:unnamed protein product [Prunus armeniaca]